ncbi:MAG: hypothetical protein OXF46_03255 [Rhodobacteraceae bacterium]|nr:hypothetical protein [Paracoccaceae bacterium]
MAGGKNKIPIRNILAYLCATAATILWILFFFEVSRGGGLGETSQNNRGAAPLIIGLIPILFFWLVAGLYLMAVQNRKRYSELKKKINKLKEEIDHISFGESERFMNIPTDSPPMPSESPVIHEELEYDEPAGEIIDSPFSLPMPSDEVKGETRSMLDEWDLDTKTLIRAFNMPNDENDSEGYDAIEAAIKIGPLGNLLRNSHELLIILADYDLIMDDLEIDMGLITTWRRFAADSAVGMVSSLGGTGTFVEIDKVSSILAENSNFESLANTFNKQMEEFISKVIPQLSDDEIRELAQTRTFLAFLLLGQVFNTG